MMSPKAGNMDCLSAAQAHILVSHMGKSLLFVFSHISVFQSSE